MAERDVGFVEITSCEIGRFRRWTKAAIIENIRLLSAMEERAARGEVTRSRLQDLKRASAFSHNQWGLWMDDELMLSIDPIEAVTVDWVHNSMQDGTFTTEVCLRVERQFR